MADKKGMLGEFKEFVMRGNVMDMAIGVIIGGAFGTIVTSLIEDIIMPVISLATGGLDFNNWFVSLDGSKYATLEAAKEAGAATLNYGAFITTILNFIILAFVIFMIVKGINKLHKKEEAAPTTKKCPFCKSDIPIEATKCPHCTSDIPEEEAA